MITEVSYEAMVRNGESISFYNEGAHYSFQISQIEKAECLLAFEVRKTGTWPTADRIKEVLKLCGLDPIVKTVNGKEVVL